jgi:hypothetical protein
VAIFAIYIFQQKGFGTFFFFNEFWPFGDKKGDANYPKVFLENAHLVTRFQGGKKVELTTCKA